MDDSVPQSRVASRSPSLRSRLLRNDGFGRFDDVTGDVGLDLRGIGQAFTRQFVDVDGDGHQDLLLVAGDFCTSRLFRNSVTAQFDDITEEVRARYRRERNGIGGR